MTHAVDHSYTCNVLHSSLKAELRFLFCKQNFFSYCTPTHRPQIGVFITCTHTWTSSHKHTKYAKGTLFFCDSTSASLSATSLNTQDVFDSPPFPLPRSQSCVMKNAFIFNMLGFRGNIQDWPASLVNLRIKNSSFRHPATFH